MAPSYQDFYPEAMMVDEPMDIDAMDEFTHNRDYEYMQQFETPYPLGPLMP